MRNSNDEVAARAAVLPSMQGPPVPNLRRSTICWQLCIAVTIAIATNLDPLSLHVFPSKGREGADPPDPSPWSFTSVEWVREDTQPKVLATGQDGPASTKKSSRAVHNSTREWPLPFVPTATYYSNARHDRSGSAIAEMLKAHAYCFMKGWEFGGVCGETTHKEANENIMRAMGLGDIVAYSCPENEEQATNFLSKSEYAHLEWKTFSPQWLDYMSLASGATAIQEARRDTDVFRIAVHIRRGDVSLCTGNAWRRYLPNSHYIRLIDQVLANLPTGQPYKVTIYSESDHHDGKAKRQYETFEDFTSRNYSVSLDQTVSKTWKRFIRSDVFIASKSGFSMVPAYLRFDRVGVIFTPHKYANPLPHWEVADEDFLAVTDAVMERLQSERCPSDSTRRRTRRRRRAQRRRISGLE